VTGRRSNQLNYAPLCDWSFLAVFFPSLCSSPFPPLPEIAVTTKRLLVTNTSLSYLTHHLEDAQRDLICRTLKQANGIIDGSRGAVALLGVKRTTLYSRTQKLGISRKKKMN
jgi:transcriptional regulator with GAF, ATPase, and Fis domain